MGIPDQSSGAVNSRWKFVLYENLFEILVTEQSLFFIGT